MCILFSERPYGTTMDYSSGVISLSFFLVSSEAVHRGN